MKYIIQIEIESDFNQSQILDMANEMATLIRPNQPIKVEGIKVIGIIPSQINKS